MGSLKASDGIVSSSTFQTVWFTPNNDFVDDHEAPNSRYSIGQNVLCINERKVTVQHKKSLENLNIY